jgi:two-component system sensor histidine kinase DevS
MVDEGDGVGAAGSAFTDDALRSVVDAAPDGIVVVDEAGIVVFVNPMAERLFEFGRDELLGGSVDRLLPLALQPAHAARRAAYADHPRTRPMGSGLELLGRTQSGSEIPLEISLSPLSSGGRMLVIAIVRDVSDRRRTDEELARARAVLDVVNERERIARDLHDTVIQRLFAIGLSLQAALIQTGADPAAVRMNQAIDDIDDTIRDVRSAIFALHTRRPGGANLRDEVVTIAHEAARGLGFEPALSFDGPIDSAATNSMREHLVATLREALSNVAKHAGATSVNVEVAIRGQELVLRVADDGTGIGAQHRGAGNGGAGNGMANMRDRAEGLGGRCDVNESSAGGTNVEWRVPLTNPAD